MHSMTIEKPLNIQLPRNTAHEIFDRRRRPGTTKPPFDFLADINADLQISTKLTKGVTNVLIHDGVGIRFFAKRTIIRMGESHTPQQSNQAKTDQPPHGLHSTCLISREFHRYKYPPKEFIATKPRCQNTYREKENKSTEKHIY